MPGLLKAQTMLHIRDTGAIPAVSPGFIDVAGVDHAKRRNCRSENDRAANPSLLKREVTTLYDLLGFCSQDRQIERPTWLPPPVSATDAKLSESSD